MAWLTFEQSLQVAFGKPNSGRGRTGLSAGMYQHHGVSGNPNVTSQMSVAVSSQFLSPPGLDSNLDLRRSIYGS